MSDDENFNVNKAIGHIKFPSIFDKLIKEISISSIPPIYINKVIVFFNDGNSLEILGSSLSLPIPHNIPHSTQLNNTHCPSIKDIKVFINTVKLEDDVMPIINSFLNPYPK